MGRKLPSNTQLLDPEGRDQTVLPVLIARDIARDKQRGDGAPTSFGFELYIEIGGAPKLIEYFSERRDWLVAAEIVEFLERKRMNTTVDATREKQCIIVDDDWYTVTRQTYIKLQAIGSLLQRVAHGIECVGEAFTFGAAMSDY